jgi:AcrR family transcriptional regulator
MSKGDLTRHTILERAFRLAARAGLEALTTGRLADDTGMSKSGLFAHFGAKEVLQTQVLGYAAECFVDGVIRPALKAPRGEPRLRALFNGWMRWAREAAGRGGCLFVGAATELDDKPGPVRDELVKQQRDWLHFIAGAVNIAIDEGQVRAVVDADQFAYELHGIMLGYYHASRLLKDPAAERRARRAFEALLRGVMVREGKSRADTPPARRSPRTPAAVR